MHTHMYICFLGSVFFWVFMEILCFGIWIHGACTVVLWFRFLGFCGVLVLRMCKSWFTAYRFHIHQYKYSHHDHK